MRRFRVIHILVVTVFAVAVISGWAFCADTRNAPASPAKPAQSTCGCGSGSGGCGSATAAKPANPLKLTAYQEKKIADIDRQHDAQVKKLQPQFAKKSAEVTKLIEDPKSSDQAIRKAMHELADLRAELHLAMVFAQRASDRVYTPHQRAMLKESAGTCGCGSACGACAAPTPSSSKAQDAIKAGK